MRFALSPFWHNIWTLHIWTNFAYYTYYFRFPDTYSTRKVTNTASFTIFYRWISTNKIYCRYLIWPSRTVYYPKIQTDHCMNFFVYIWYFTRYACCNILFIQRFHWCWIRNYGKLLFALRQLSSPVINCCCRSAKLQNAATNAMLPLKITTFFWKKTIIRRFLTLFWYKIAPVANIDVSTIKIVSKVLSKGYNRASSDNAHLLLLKLCINSGVHSIFSAISPVEALRKSLNISVDWCKNEAK